MPHQTCDLAELSMSVIQDCVARAIEKHIDLGYEGLAAGLTDGQLKGNPILLKELVRNLVDNAINYTPSSAERPGVITVRVLAESSNQVLVLQVEDSGPGVPVAERELVFQPFYRALGTGADGSGLGWAIVREIAQQHNAMVHLAETHVAQASPGARFSIRFSTEAAPE